MKTIDSVPMLARDMKKAIARVKPAVNTRTTIKVLHHVRLHDGRLVATNMLHAVSTPFALAEGVDVLVPFDALSRLASALKAGDEVVASVDGDELVLVHPRGTTRIPTFADRDDWPSIPMVPDGGGFRFDDPVAALDTLRAVSAGCSGDESRPVLQSMVVVGGAGGVVRVESCDSYSLLRADVRGRGAVRAFPWLPGPLLAKLDQVDAIIDVHDHSDESKSEYARHDVFLVDRASDTTAWIRGTVGDVWPSDRLVPDSWEWSAAVPDGLVDAVAFGRKVIGKSRVEGPVRLAPVSSNGVESLGVSMSVQDGPSHSDSFGLDGSVGVFDGSIGVNPTRLVDAIGFVGDGASLSLISRLRPLLLRSGDRLALVMPTRLPE